MSAENYAAVRRMDWMDYLRLLCAILVMLDHFALVGLDRRVSNGISGYGLLTEIARFGNIALFVFFMMSGLVITLVAQSQSAASFVTHRATRVYPTFLLCLTITALLAPFGPARFAVTLPQYLANLTLHPMAFGYRYVDASYWTLPVEIAFYAAMVAVIMAGWIRHLQSVVAVWVLLQLACAPFFPNLPLFGYLYSFLAAGAVFALLYQRRNEWLNYGLLAISFLLCQRCVFIVARQAGFNFWIGGAAITLVFALFLLMRGRQVDLPWARRIGSLTYPLYLLHFHVGLTLMSWWVGEANKWVMLVGIMLGLIALSALIDDVIEFRLRRVWAGFFRVTIARPFAWIEARRVTRSPV
jgi:peptidoglycan/LPS O-acetylase OafA/YrhL